MRKPLKILEQRNDSAGMGGFGASRGKRKHNGIDYCADVGENVYAPISGKVRLGYVYKNSLEMRLVEITNQEYQVKIMYVSPIVKNEQDINVGDLIGYAQNISAYWNSKNMINHIHIEVRKNGVLIDPKTMFNQ